MHTFTCPASPSSPVTQQLVKLELALIIMHSNNRSSLVTIVRNRKRVAHAVNKPAKKQPMTSDGLSHGTMAS